MGNSYAFAQVGRTGLGNMLFPWARSEIYAARVGAKVLAPRWVQLMRIGPWLRSERDKRYYTRQFSNDGCIGGLRKWILLHTKAKVPEEEVHAGGDASGEGKVAVFSGIREFFSPLIDHHELVVHRLREIMHPRLRPAARAGLDAKHIAIHIRRGDFNAATGEYPVPDAWYVTCLQQVREAIGEQAPALVFSDGRPEELEFITREPSVELADRQPAIVDIFRMSNANVLITTPWSTFSMWAAYIGQMPNLWSPRREVKPVMVHRPQAQITTDDEGHFDEPARDVLASCWKAD